MKILLINPPKKNEITGTLPYEISEKRGCFPPLGLLYVAAYLLKYSEHEVSVIDSQVEEMTYKDIQRRIEIMRPDIIGITTMTHTMLDVLKTAKIAKEVNEKIKVVLGGPHINIFPDETIRIDNIDYLVLGEGEKVFKELLDNIDSTEKIKRIPGIVFMENGMIVNTGLPAPIQNLNSLPFPARKLLPYKKYNSFLTKGNIVTSIFTSRGCPYQCSFCNRPHLGKVFRARSPKNVVDELEECTKIGIRDFLIYDDSFTVNKMRVIDICKEIIKRKIRINWDIRARVDTVDEEILLNLQLAGCKGIHYGVEAGTNKILKILNKNITIDQVKKAFYMTKKNKMFILAYFMIGNPSETKNDIRATFRVMKELNPDYIHLAIFTPLPETKIYIDGLKNGCIKTDYWKEFSKKPVADFILPFWHEHFTREELISLLIKGYKQFYMRPGYIVKKLLELRSWKELRIKSLAGIGILKMKKVKLASK